GVQTRAPDLVEVDRANGRDWLRGGGLGFAHRDGSAGGIGDRPPRRRGVARARERPGKPFPRARACTSMAAMRLVIRLFAGLKERAGAGELVLDDLPEPRERAALHALLQEVRRV